MDSVENAFNEYVAAFNAGDFDPRPFLARLDETDRPRLELLIDSFLEEAPPREYSEEAFESSGARDLAASVLENISGASGQWPVLLPKLRDEQGLMRSQVVDRLAAELEADPSETEKIGDYLHDMEWGTLPAKGVSGRVLEALAGIYRTTAEALADAGRALGPPTGRTGPVYLRVPSDQEYVAAADEESALESRSADPPDRIDRLFTAGD
jgi:hypothetical protein